jgi:hypothetical protein
MDRSKPGTSVEVCDGLLGDGKGAGGENNHRGRSPGSSPLDPASQFSTVSLQDLEWGPAGVRKGCFHNGENHEVRRGQTRKSGVWDRNAYTSPGPLEEHQIRCFKSWIRILMRFTYTSSGRYTGFCVVSLSSRFQNRCF